MQVHAAAAHECVIELITEVGGQNKNGTIGIPNPIQRVEQPREREWRVLDPRYPLSAIRLGRASRASIAALLATYLLRDCAFPPLGARLS